MIFNSSIIRITSFQYSTWAFSENKLNKLKNYSNIRMFKMLWFELKVESAALSIAGF